MITQKTADKTLLHKICKAWGLSETAPTLDKKIYWHKQMQSMIDYMRSTEPKTKGAS